MTKFKAWALDLTYEAFIINPEGRPEVGMKCDVCPALAHCGNRLNPICVDELRAWANSKAEPLTVERALRHVCDIMEGLSPDDLDEFVDGVRMMCASREAAREGALKGPGAPGGAPRKRGSPGRKKAAATPYI